MSIKSWITFWIILLIVSTSLVGQEKEMLSQIQKDQLYVSKTIGTIFIKNSSGKVDKSSRTSSLTNLLRLDESIFLPSQKDSIRLMLLDAKHTVPYSYFLIPHLGLDSPEFVRMLQQQLHIDTMYYGGGFGGNRFYSDFNKELAAHLVLAKMGYAYHAYFVDTLLREQNYVTKFHPDKLTTILSFSRYLANPLSIRLMLDIANDGINYPYFDPHQDPMNTFFSPTRMVTKSIPIDYQSLCDFDIGKAGDVSKEQEKSELIACLKKNRTTLMAMPISGENPFKHYRFMMDVVQPLKPARCKYPISEYKYKRYEGKIEKPFLQYLGKCYFDGDTILLTKQSPRKIWLMAWKNSEAVADESVNWYGVDSVQLGTYAHLDLERIIQGNMIAINVTFPSTDDEPYEQKLNITLKYIYEE